METKILDYYREFSMYTNPGLYRHRLEKDLPDDVKKIGELVRKQIIHRTTLAAGNTGTNADKRFGDMNKVPWYRQPEDDVLPTAAATLAELYRRDERGFIENRKEQDKLVLTCRFVAILMAAILKSKGFSCRVRSGNAFYFEMGDLGDVSADHWINQYWSAKKKRWVTIDVDGSWSLNDDFDPYDLPKEKFDFPADAWLNIRNNKDNPDRFWNAKPERGLIVVLWSLFYDFHCLMNNEIIYVHYPRLAKKKNFKKMSQKDYQDIDELAELMKDPDKNFDALQVIWNNNKRFRLLKGGLL